MPDPQRLTISATEAAALFDASPYLTRWMLYKRLADGLDISKEADSRMDWGKKMQPLVLAQAAVDLALEVHPNATDTYVRRDLFGCTRDAEIICPERGPGACETKCVFGWDVWQRDWQGGRFVPRQHEIQLQTQMMVGDGTLSYEWGVIPVWACGEMHYFERKPDPEFQRMLIGAGAGFLDAVRRREEPDPFGEPIEAPLLQRFFPLVKGSVLDLTADVAAEELAQLAADMTVQKKSERFYKKAADAAKVRLLAAAKGNATLLLPKGVVVTVSEVHVKAHQRHASTSQRLKVFVPDAAPAGDVEDFETDALA